MSRNILKQKLSEINFEMPKSTDDFANLFEKSFGNEKTEGSLTKGIITNINAEFITIDIGMKAEGQISTREFMHLGKMPEIKVGDEVEVFIEKIENRQGKTILSKEQADRKRSWDKIKKEYENGTNMVEGALVGKVKGGFAVDVDGILAFLPGSQVDVRPIRDISPLLNIMQPFQILKIDEIQGNIVVSRRAILEESRTEARNELLSNIQEGAILEGIVKNITSYGVFVDLGGYDGLCHLTDISYERINHPSEKLTLGQAVKVMVTKYDQESKRISLGIKQLESNPWDGVDKRFPVGSIQKGKVTNIAEYGAFVELEPGIEGLVYITDISWTKNNIHPRKLLSVSEEVEVKVLSVDVAKHRISLGIKQCENNPWQQFASKYPIGSVIEGEIKNVVEFGFFIGLDHNIDGLVHISDLSWAENDAEAIKKYQKGQKVKAKVLSTEIDKERISLGIKQLEENPLEEAMSKFKKGSVVTCTVKEIREDGIEVELANSITSFIKKADLSRDRIEQRTERFAVGDRVDVKIISVDKKKISSSIKALEIEQEKKAIAEYGSTDSGASLGDILGLALNQANDKKDNSDK